MRNKNLILNYIFIVGILILFINDQFFKFKFPGLITGKLSDVCGIIIFPLLLTYIFPKLKEHSVWVAILIFTYWKSEYSQGVIDFYNRFSPIETSRVIDYTDLLVFVLIPIPYFILKKEELLAAISIKINQHLILFPSIFIFISEAPPESYYYTYTDRYLTCSGCNIIIHQNIDDIISELSKNEIVFDSFHPINITTRGIVKKGAKKLYKRELILDKDTLRNIDVTFVPLKQNKTKIYFNGMDIPKNIPEDDIKNNLDNKLRRHYKELIFNEIKNKFK